MSDLLHCEARDIVKRHYPNGSKALDAYLIEVAKKRGQPASDELRKLCREEWRKMGAK